MMVGKNTLSVTEQTMIAALQYWFEQVMFKDGKCPMITKIAAGASGSGYNSATVFSVDLDERPVVQAATPKP